MTDHRRAVADLRANANTAHAEVVRLCAGGRWTMRVPVNETRDSDTVIEAAVTALDKACDALDRVLDLADRWDNAAVQHDMRGDQRTATRYAAVARQARAAVAPEPSP